MININTVRGRYILKPTVPAGTTSIQYTVSIGGNLIFLGRSKYFGGTYEVDCSDWLESYIAKQTSTVTSVTVTVVFSYSGGTTQTMTLTWAPYVINREEITFTGTYAYLALTNCGFVFYGGTPIKVPLSVTNGILDGKTIDNLDKITYMDRYGDKHNGSITNHYELECYIDPCWLSVETGEDIEYEKVMLALQGSLKTTLVAYNVKISGMTGTSVITTEVRVKDVEKIDTYSSYSTDKKVPSYKITLEIYR